MRLSLVAGLLAALLASSATGAGPRAGGNSLISPRVCAGNYFDDLAGRCDTNAQDHGS